MKFHLKWIYIIMLVALIHSVSLLAGSNEIPHLRKQGTATQLIVGGKPFLMIGGELGNSSASSMATMEPIWPKLQKLHLNTLLAPVYWELIEPEKNTFDFSLVDQLIQQARAYDLKLVLLWFGSWKNSMSCYAPYWVKADQERFPRAMTKEGKGKEILSCFSEANMEADKDAFVQLMKHIRGLDEKEQTVIMVQVENEIGMIPDSRDRSEIADELYTKPVPKPLLDYLAANKDALIPEFHDVWQKTGFRQTGTWEEVFGEGVHTDELFMAWYYARYVESVASAGKAEYPLPMYVNAALIRPGYLPGQYPSAGPLPHLMDIWRAGAPSIDFISPDIYFPNFAEWCQKYHRNRNPLFIPEAGRNEMAAVNVYYALGQHDALGYSPFSIESTDNPLKDPIGKSYTVISQLSDLILQNQGNETMRGVLVDEENPEARVSLGDYTFVCTHEYTSKWTARAPGEGWPRKGCLIISTAPDEYTIAGSGVIVTFESAQPDAFIVGIGSIDEGKFVNGQWNPGLRMNGDQSHQGRNMRLSHWEHGIQRIKLYRYQ